MKIHFKDPEYNGTLCHCGGAYVPMTKNIDEVTCEGCNARLDKMIEIDSKWNMYKGEEKE